MLRERCHGLDSLRFLIGIPLPEPLDQIPRLCDTFRHSGEQCLRGYRLCALIRHRLLPAEAISTERQAANKFIGKLTPVLPIGNSETLRRKSRFVIGARYGHEETPFRE